jgi:hypothetical protein
MKQTIPRPHNLLPHNIGKDLKGWFHYLCPMAFIKTPRLLIENIGPEIQLLLGLRNIIADEGYNLPWILFKSDPCKFRKNLALYSIQKT